MHFWDLIKGKKEFKIGWLGGSITEGTDHIPSYRERVDTWVQERVPDVRIVDINAAIGGTASDLGVCRMDHDLLSKNPDVVFIEFAVNDNASERELSAKAMEGIIRKCLKKGLPAAVVFTVHMDMINHWIKKGKTPWTVDIHKKIADHYGVPCVDVGAALAAGVLEDESKQEDYFVDGTHPTDLGHSIYTEAMKEFLDRVDFQINFHAEPLDPDCYENAGMVPAASLANEQWKLAGKDMFGRLDDFIYSSAPGDELEFSFEGTMAGVYWTIEADSGDALISVDGGEWEKAQCWDEFAPRFGRACYRILAYGLPKGKHTLRLKVSPEKPEQSKGTYLRIGAFLTDQ